MTAERREAERMEVGAREESYPQQNMVWHQPFWEEHRRLVETYCRRMLPNGDWESAAQDVFLKAFQNWETLHDVKNPSAWLVTVSRRHCLNILRDTREAPIPFDDLAERYLRDTDSPYACVEDQIVREQLWAEIKRRAALWNPPWDAIDWNIFEAIYGDKRCTAKETAASLGLEFDKVRYRLNYHIRPLFREIEPI